MSPNMGSLLIGLALGAAQLANASPAANAPVYVTQVVSALTTYCPGPTVITHGPKTYTIKEATTFTITDCPCTITHTGPVPTGQPSSECATNCADAYNKCRSSDANRSTCASGYASCLGYSPFGPDGSLITPTACSGTTVPPVPMPTVSMAPGADCPKACADSYDKCRGAPDANRATCAAEYAGCLGYSPFGPDGSLVTPTACSAATVPPVPMPTVSMAPTAPAGSECAQKCYDAYNVCRSAPNANRSTCASNYAGCLGYSLFGPDGSLVTPTACSASATGSKPTGTAPATPSVVVVAGAERASFASVFGALGACGLVAAAFL